MNAGVLNRRVLLLEAVVIGFPLTASIGMGAFVASIGLLPAVLLPRDWRLTAFHAWLAASGCAVGVYGYWALLSCSQGWYRASVLAYWIALASLHIGLMTISGLLMHDWVRAELGSMLIAGLAVGSHVALSGWWRVLPRGL